MAGKGKCQSCGMPLKNDLQGGGSNADGTLSQEYCSHCYIGGRFVEPNMTVDEMKMLVLEKLQEKGFPKFVASFFTLGLKRLKRWR